MKVRIFDANGSQIMIVKMVFSMLILLDHDDR